MVGNNVSHSKRRTKRKYYPNLFVKKFFLPSTSEWITLKVSAAGIRNINKLGIETALKQALEKGFI
jgi:large subunit ribosomal protein L28